jgi:hypothetical protein
MGLMDKPGRMDKTGRTSWMVRRYRMHDKEKLRNSAREHRIRESTAIPEMYSRLMVFVGSNLDIFPGWKLVNGGRHGG